MAIDHSAFHPSACICRMATSCRKSCAEAPSSSVASGSDSDLAEEGPSPRRSSDVTEEVGRSVCERPALDRPRLSLSPIRPPPPPAGAPGAAPPGAAPPSVSLGTAGCPLAAAFGAGSGSGSPIAPRRLDCWPSRGDLLSEPPRA
eukprot:scaffold38127_cov42-Phaeocystis_antarctica.AAC.1